MNKTTPSPWLYSYNGETRAFLIESDGTTIAEISTTKNSTAHKCLKKNIQLITAAPILLDALRQIRLCEFNSMSSRREIVKIAKQAIERAEGNL